MGKFTQYLGKTEIEIDGLKLELDVTLDDMKKIITASKGNEVTEEGIDKLGNLFKAIVKRSYPDEPEEEINKFVEKKFITLMNEFSIEVMGVPREEMQKSFRKGEESQQSGKKGKILQKTEK